VLINRWGPNEDHGDLFQTVFILFLQLGLKRDRGPGSPLSGPRLLLNKLAQINQKRK